MIHTTVVKGGVQLRSMVYLQMKKKIEAQPGHVIRVGEVAKVLSEKDTEKLEALSVTVMEEKWGGLFIIDWMEVVFVIQKYNPNLDIRSVGPPQTIVEWKPKTKTPPWFYVVLVWSLLFVGSGLAIMNFHADVSMKEVHERIYYLLTGMNQTRPLILQIPYSLGIGIGMILFFNRLFKQKINNEPSPLELEVFLYQESIDQYVIDHEKTKGRRGDSHGSSR